MTAAANAINVVRTAILGMNAAMLANPIGLLVALIVGLVATFIYLWNNVDGFKQFWIDAWKLIQDKAGQAKDWIVEKWNNIGTWFSNKFSAIKKAGKDAIDNVKKFFSDGYKNITNKFASIGSWFGEKFRNAWTNIKNAFSNWGSFFSELWGKVKNKFGDIGSKIGSTMGGAVKTAMNGIIRLIEGAINKGIGLINSAIKLANKLPTINLSTLPKISLPRLAKGAVVDKETPAIIGEDGAEAVVPLERNTQWIDKVASKFENRMDGVSSQILIERMNRIINLLEQMMDKNIYLDSGVLVGELASGIDASLGAKYKHIQRRNTR
jgi:hypothetical protein